MNTYSIEFTETDGDKVARLLDFVRSLDFVKSIKPAAVQVISASEEPITDSNNVQTLAVIKALYPNEWVLLSHTQREDSTILGGNVLLHSPDKTAFAVLAKDIIRLHPAVTHVYTGKTPKIAHVGLARKI